MDYDDLDEERERALAPERVDERLDRLAKLKKPFSNKYEQPPDPENFERLQAVFLEALKLGRVYELPLLGGSNTPHQSTRESGPLSPAPRYRLTDLPLDVFLEVAPHLYPLDLINLSRTSKTLRSLLLSKSSQRIWTTSVGNVVELPPCPLDMSEPLYAALVFDSHCFACGVNGAFTVDYALRIRMCEPCFKENVVEAERFLRFLSTEDREIVGDVVLMLLPSANTFNFRKAEASMHRINPLSHLVGDSYLKSELQTVLHFFQPCRKLPTVADLRTLVRTRVNYVMKRQAHAALVHGWDTVHCTVDDHDERFSLFSRFKRVLSHLDTVQLRGQDWDEATYHLDPAFFEYLGIKVGSPSPLEADPADSYPSIEGAANPASPTGPESELPKPHDQLATEMRLRKARESDALDARVRARYALLEEWYNYFVNYVKEDYKNISPNFYNATRVWDDLVRADDARAPFNDNVIARYSEALAEHESLENYPLDAVNSLTRTLHAAKARRAEEEAARENEEGDHDEGGHGKKGRKDKGRKRVRMEVPRLPEDPIMAVQHPMALFSCAECEDCGFAWPGINMHWCEEHRDKSVWDDYGEFKAEVWEDGAMMAEAVLTVLVARGLEKRERGMRQLDYLIKEGRVFCACGDPEMAGPREGLDWAALVGHICDHLTENARRLGAQNKEGASVWIDDHLFSSCLRYLPRNADTSEASYRVRTDPETRARIDACLKKCPYGSRPLCRLCEGLVPDDQKDSTLFLPRNANAVLYHMKAKHGQDFDEKSLVFRQSNAFASA